MSVWKSFGIQEGREPNPKILPRDPPFTWDPVQRCTKTNQYISTPIMALLLSSNCLKKINSWLVSNCHFLPAMYPCSTKRREGLENPSPTPKNLKGQRKSWEISRSHGFCTSYIHPVRWSKFTLKACRSHDKSPQIDRSHQYRLVWPYQLST